MKECCCACGKIKKLESLFALSQKSMRCLLLKLRQKRGKVVAKPGLINEYNQNMNGCDRLDQNVSYYNNLDRNTMKGWRRIFSWILEVCK